MTSRILRPKTLSPKALLPKAKQRIPNVSVIVFNGFSPFHISVPSIVFGRDTLDEAFFNLQFIAGEEGPILSDIGMEIHTRAKLDSLEKADIIIVPYWRTIDERPNVQLIEALRLAHVRGALIVGLCLGGYVLAYAGLLAGKRAATHWELERDFTQRFPETSLDTNALYVEDNGVITSAGTAAGIDCCLYVFRKYYSSTIANRIARRMVVPPYRDGGQAQFIEQPIPITTSDSRINELMERIRNDIGRKYTLDELADSVMMTRRTFTRKFHKATGMAFGEWLASERLNLAQDLLESTDLTIDQIVVKTGFSSVLVFRDKFKERYAVTPNRWRKTFHEQN
ncbi:helix-turn-helix domain-containing protein [Vibrio fluvialis]|uniref:GlxA family transcriptional regulator n=1 Tax=Vibrio TaxID=662 RepID=UPI0015583A00|nr:helix-turn-helix domain-containing protein [Vibrio fluvialis]EKO3407513.1 helix-turn-helix domain-containing protein [Vibrio fluvialis]ELP2652763.1 helix-turn-helix domain-containing protein [Vibrio fluvialis]ELV8684292.1 helix-turn-helix domain-containing protein [Vibrio fluvialis]EMC0410373.1 helix-turn-helix domain-containing protein [Vibrio fluvialis]MBL4280096.1 helix-turn-helix domain-containing protein [Vibrio fluvialis]